MPTISDFIAQFQGGARANKYRVLLTFPFESGTNFNLSASIGAILGPLSAGATLSQGNPSNLFQFMCKGSSLPASTTGSVDVPYCGRVFKYAGDRTFSDWNCTVTNDENFSIRNAFERWSDTINGHVSNNRRVPGNLYFSTAQIQQLSVHDDIVLKSYTIFNLFPTEISEISLGFDQNDAIEEFSVNFAYSHWVSDTTS